MVIEKEIGAGGDCVYVYYNPNDKKLALLQDKDRWECKMGFSSVDPVTRIKSQGFQTSMAREPIIGLIIRTPNGYYTESFIHKILYSKKISSEASGTGDEWFLTSPEEVEKIYKNEICLKQHSTTYCEYNIPEIYKLGETLNLHRKKINLVNKSLSKSVGVSRDTIWRLFNGDGTVGIQTVLKTIDVLGLEVILKSKLPSKDIKIYESNRRVKIRK